jgi:hypothetical protein
VWSYIDSWKALPVRIIYPGQVSERLESTTSPHHLSRSGKWEVGKHYQSTSFIQIRSHNFETKLFIDIEADNFIGGWNRRDQRKPSTKRKPQVSFMAYSRHERRSNITTIVAIYTDCIYGCKYSYYTMTVTTVPKFEGGKISRKPRIKCCI